MKSPDYGAYSLEELYQALSTLDAESYPDRAALIREEIRKRKIEQPRRGFVAHLLNRSGLAG